MKKSIDSVVNSYALPLSNDYVSSCNVKSNYVSKKPTFWQKVSSHKALSLDSLKYYASEVFAWAGSIGIAYMLNKNGLDNGNSNLYISIVPNVAKTISYYLCNASSFALLHAPEYKSGERNLVSDCAKLFKSDIAGGFASALFRFPAHFLMLSLDVGSNAAFAITYGVVSPITGTSVKMMVDKYQGMYLADDKATVSIKTENSSKSNYNELELKDNSCFESESVSLSPVMERN